MREKLPAGFLFTSDPYPGYAELRAQGPIHPIDFPPGAEAFLIVDYENGRAALNDPRLSKNPGNSGVPVRADGFFGDTLLGVDPPEHTRLRNLVARAFTPRRVQTLRPRIQRIADDLIDTFAPRAEADLVDEFAFPLPIIVICELLGIPAQDRAAFREWTAILTVPALSPESRERRRTAARALNDYLGRILAERRRTPGDDLVSVLVTTELTEVELLNTISLLLIAGHETTTNLIGNGVLALLRNPDQLTLLRTRPELLPDAIEELLRYDSPVEKASQRIATTDMEIAGTTVPKGAWVHVCLGAAHRDPASFGKPDSLDITRTDNRHVAFGHGTHFCLGASLARLEGEIAIGTLLARLPGLAFARPDEEPDWKQTGSIVRGLASLPVRF